MALPGARGERRISLLCLAKRDGDRISTIRDVIYYLLINLLLINNTGETFIETKTDGLWIPKVNLEIQDKQEN